MKKKKKKAGECSLLLARVRPSATFFAARCCFCFLCLSLCLWLCLCVCLWGLAHRLLLPPQLLPLALPLPLHLALPPLALPLPLPFSLPPCALSVAQFLLPSTHLRPALLRLHLRLALRLRLRLRLRSSPGHANLLCIVSTPSATPQHAGREV